MSNKGIVRKSGSLTSRSFVKTKMDPKVFEKNEFSTPQDIVNNTESIVKSLQTSKGFELLDHEFKKTVDILKKKSEFSIHGTRQFLVKKSNHEGRKNQTIGSKPQYIELLQKNRKSRVEVSKEKQIFTEKGRFDHNAIMFYAGVKDPFFLKAADQSIENMIESSIAHADIETYLEAKQELVFTLNKYLDVFESENLSISKENQAICIDIFRKKLSFLDNSFTKILERTSENRESQSKKVFEQPAQRDFSLFSSSLNLDVRYYMSTAESQLDYYKSKMEMFMRRDEEQSEEVSGLYNKYIDAKTTMHVKSQFRSFNTHIDKLERMLEEWVKVMSSIELTSKKFEGEIGKLNEIIKEQQTSLDNEKKNSMIIHSQLRNSIGPDIVELRKEWEQNFVYVMENLRSDVAKAYEEREVAVGKNVKLMKELDSFREEKVKRESNKQDKAIQAIFQLGSAKESVQPLTESLRGLELAVATGDSSSKAWLCSMINLIILTRLSYEFDPSTRSLPPKSMKEFIVEIVLIRFGSSQTAQHIVRDIIASLRKYGNEGDRFKLFARFLGVEDVLNSEIGRKRKSNKYEEFLTNYYYTSHLAVKDYLEFCLLVKGFDYHEDTAIKPFIEFSFHRRGQMIKIENARKIFVLFILSQENKNHLDPEALEEEFENYLKEDLYDRLHEKGKEIKVRNFKTEEFYISFDYLSRVLVERRLANFISYIQRFLSALTINSAARGEKHIFFEDLLYSCKEILPQITETSIGNIFRELMDTPQLQSYSLERMIQSAVHTVVILKEQQVKTDLSWFVINRASYDDRNQIHSDAEARTDERLRRGVAKKEGSRYLSLIDGMNSWREKYIVARRTGELAEDNSVLAEKWKTDNMTQLAALQECYERIKELISNQEKTDETIAALHGDLKTFFGTFKGKVVQRTTYDDLKNQDSHDFALQLDSVWKKTRRIITIAFYHNTV